VNDDTADVDRLFARLSGEAPHRDPDDHPAPEKLSAYQANELSPEEDNEIQEHLAQCTLCTELLLDLQRFLDPPAEDLPREGVADFETAAGWRELRGRMGERQVVVAPGSQFGQFLSFGSLRAWQSLAAVLVVGVLAFGGYALYLRQQSRVPEADLITASLDPDGETRSSVERVELEGRMRTIVLTLRLPVNRTDYSGFAAEIVGKDGIHSSIEELRPYREAFNLRLPLGSVKPGAVRITLWGVRDGKRERIVATYSMTLVP